LDDGTNESAGHLVAFLRNCDTLRVSTA